MSAAGAVTGNGVYSEIAYKGHRFKVAQWFVDAMEAVSTAAFLKAARMVKLMGGTPRMLADREVALARTFSMGGFEFDAMMEEGISDPELLATFLHQLLLPHDASVTFALAMEMVKADKAAVLEALGNANPQNGQREDKGPTADKNPGAEAAAGQASATTGIASPNPGSPGGMPSVGQ